MNQVNSGTEHSGGVAIESLRPAHGFKLCRTPHRADEWGAPHCECGKSHEHHGFTLPERIFTCGGSEGRFFAESGTFSNIGYTRDDLIVPEREAGDLARHGVGGLPTFPKGDLK